MLKNLKERHDKPKFKDTPLGQIILIYGPIIVICIFLWLIFDKFLSTAAAQKAAAEVGKEVMDKAAQVLSGLDKVCSGSGIR